MATNSINLTNRRISAIKGLPAYLPNQPLNHNLIVSPNETATIECGDALAFDTTVTTAELTYVKKAAPTDVIIGYVAYNPIKTGFVANDKISATIPNYFIYLVAGEANITAGTKLAINADGQVVTYTAGNGVAGMAYTNSTAIGDFIIVMTPSGLEPIETA